MKVSSSFSRRLIGVLLPLLTTPVQVTGAAGVPDTSAPALTGRVVNAETGEPVYFALLNVVGTNLTRYTERDGRFAFERLPAGAYALYVHHIAFDDLTTEAISVGPGLSPDLELALVPRVIPLEMVTVTPGAFSFMESGGAVRQTMSREDILSVPQLGEDVFRAVNRLPGLSSGDYSAHFSIRGGRHDETLILLDGLELYEPYHLKDFDEGAISIIDSEMIQGVELMTGGFPVAYGNKRSGVFKISSRRPENDRPRYGVGLSFMNARAMAMGPLGEGKGSWLASARSGYMDLVFGLIKQNDLPSPRYQDVFAKVQWHLNESHSLSIDGLHAGDRYTFDAAATTGFQDSLRTREKANNSYGNSYAWATLSSSLGDRTVVRNTVSAGLVTRSRDGYEKYVDLSEPLYEVTNDRDLTILGLKQDWTIDLTDAIVLTAGADLRRLKSKDVTTSIVGQDPNDPSPDPDEIYPVRTDTRVDETGTTLGAYLSGRWRVASPLILEAGGRYDRASYTGDRDLSPRLSGSLGLGEGLTLRLGWGEYRQIQAIDDVAVLNDDRSYCPSELSTQWTAGLEKVLERGAVLRIEGYSKEGSELRPVYRNWKGGIDVFPETNEDRILVYPRRTTATGVETYYDQDLGERFSVRASYAFSVIEEEVDRIRNVNGPDNLEYDAKHPVPQSQRHAANVDCTYRLARAWSLNASLAIHSGWPATLESLEPVTDENGNPDFTVLPRKIYGARLPHYHRLDVRATRRWATSRGDWRVFFELVNLTNHGNVWGYDYFKTFDGSGGYALQRDEETWFTILPSLGASWNAAF